LTTIFWLYRVVQEVSKRNSRHQDRDISYEKGTIYRPILIVCLGGGNIGPRNEMNNGGMYLTEKTARGAVEKYWHYPKPYQ